MRRPPQASRTQGALLGAGGAVRWRRRPRRNLSARPTEACRRLAKSPTSLLPPGMEEERGRGRGLWRPEGEALPLPDAQGLQAPEGAGLGADGAPFVVHHPAGGEGRGGWAKGPSRRVPSQPASQQGKWVDTPHPAQSRGSPVRGDFRFEGNGKEESSAHDRANSPSLHPTRNRTPAWIKGEHLRTPLPLHCSLLGARASPPPSPLCFSRSGKPPAAAEPTPAPPRIRPTCAHLRSGPWWRW